MHNLGTSSSSMASSSLTEKVKRLPSFEKSSRVVAKIIDMDRNQLKTRVYVCMSIKSISTYSHIYIYIYIYILTYMYIYIEREREGESHAEVDRIW